MTKVVVGKGISTKAWARDASSDVDEKVVAFAESKGLLEALAQRGGWSEEDGFIDDAWILLTDADESDLDHDAAVVAYATLPRTEDDEMKTFKIVSSAGVDLGTYEAESPQAALDAMAREAGCESHIASARAFGVEVMSIDDLRDAEGVEGSWTTEAWRFRGGRIDLFVEEVEG